MSPSRLVRVYACLRCGHETRTRDGKRPLRCGGCKSPYWDRERTSRQTGGGDRKASVGQ